MSNVGTTTHSNFRPVCSRCGGTAFKAKRSAAGKAVAGALASKTRLKCLKCGAEFDKNTVPTAFVSTVVSGPAADAGHTQAAGWYPDPLGRHELRWWGGVSWMDTVRDGDLQGVDPIDPGPSAQPVQRTVGEQLRELSSLRDEGLLTDEEYEAQKARLLS